MSQRRIKTLSHRLSLLCGGLILMIPVVCILYWGMSSTEAISRQFLGEPGAILQLSGAQRRMAVVLTAIAVVPLGLALASLRQLLRLYAEGTIFDAQNVAAIGKIGKWLVWFGVAQFVDATLIPLVLTLSNPPGHRILSITLSMGVIEAVLLGAVMLVIAHVMDEARIIADEQAQTV
ncbi:Protein of unknown function [Enhydrobacter aerosaccus]|uniref:DUF2975 domain-containing protein n=1 Tax=Enhydrobacter aerosaccus TaxID=225324 RepID=A0A1T4SPF6_9HYPH|nr:DUF2975 domain-containing protein [Enhydrobacter aerosaccus]SKA30129.1 Protein of unknown function [Enhydrobacter aerosaccus]